MGSAHPDIHYSMNHDIWGFGAKFSSESPPLAMRYIAAGIHRRPMVGATYAPTTNKVVPYLFEWGIVALVAKG